jgi:trehalose/maltose hydrolase-like predicted phosphorylase|tara:strand:- start:507 stop:911 length:405 start_codon:yes stop_codon:yes gene_type:complete
MADSYEEYSNNEELKKSITVTMIESDIYNLREEVQEFYNINSKLHKFSFNKLLEEHIKKWKHTYKNVYIKSPKLFNGLVQNMLDPTILNNMLQKIKEMENNTISNKTGTEEVGELLFNKFVKPNLDKYPKKNEI